MLRALKVLHDRLRHEQTNQANRISEVQPGDSEVFKDFDYLSETFWVACSSRVGAKLHIPMHRSQDGFVLHHTELEEHTQYAFGGADYFDPKEVMKVHDACRNWDLTWPISSKSALMMTKPSPYSKY